MEIELLELGRQLIGCKKRQTSAQCQGSVAEHLTVFAKMYMEENDLAILQFSCLNISKTDAIQYINKAKCKTEDMERV